MLPNTFEDAFNVEPDGAAEFEADALYVGSGGAVRLETSFGRIVDFEARSGSVIPVACNRVLAEGTTAKHLVGLVNHGTAITLATCTPKLQSKDA